MRLIPIPELVMSDIFHLGRYLSIFSCYHDLAEKNNEDILKRYNAACVHRFKENGEECVHNIWSLFPEFSLEDNLECISSFGGKDGLSKDIEERRKRGWIAGNILLTMCICEGEGRECGIRRGIHVVSESKCVKFNSRSYVKNAWSDFKSVAHFHAAAIISDMIAADRDKNQIAQARSSDPEAYLVGCCMDALIFLLNVRKLYRFSISKIDKRTKQPPVNANDAWIFPLDILDSPAQMLAASHYSDVREVLSKIEFKTEKFSVDDKTKGLLRSYRA